MNIKRLLLLQILLENTLWCRESKKVGGRMLYVFVITCTTNRGTRRSFEKRTNSVDRQNISSAKWQIGAHAPTGGVSYERRSAFPLVSGDRPGSSLTRRRVSYHRWRRRRNTLRSRTLSPFPSRRRHVLCVPFESYTAASRVPRVTRPVTRAEK